MASRSRTGTIGFLGGMSGPTIWPFEAGFEAGARAVNPTIRILTIYLSPFGDFGGFQDPAMAEAVAGTQYRTGADIIFAAAGDSALGVFKAATDLTPSLGRQLWAIGVDTDQYLTVADDPANVAWRDWQAHILTSVIKRMDTGVYSVVTAYGRGSPIPQTMNLDLAAHGVDIAYSGKYIEDLRPVIDAWRARIVGGGLVVPCILANRPAQAQSLGLTPSGCGP